MSKNKNKKREFGIFEKRLYLTIQKGEFEKAKELIDKKKENVNQKLLDAVKEENVEKVKEYLNKGGEGYNIKNITLSELRCGYATHEKSVFTYAVESGNKEIIELFILRDNEYVNFDICKEVQGIFHPPERVPLTIAIEKGYNDIVKLLLEKGADPLKEIDNEKGRNALEYAISVNNIEAVKMILETEIKCFGEYGQAMCLAIEKNNLKVTEMLIDWIIKKRNNVDFTFRPNFSIYEDSYLSPFIFKDSYVTPLTVAAIEGKKEIVELLLKKGAKFEFNNKMFQQEPVISALTRHGSKEMIEFIIEKGAKVNVKDCEGITPLMHAVYHGRKDVVELLIKKGANVNEKDYKGKSVLEMATKEINRTIEKMLIENGAKISFKNALFNWRLILSYLKQN